METWCHYGKGKYSQSFMLIAQLAKMWAHFLSYPAPNSIGYNRPMVLKIKKSVEQLAWDFVWRSSSQLSSRSYSWIWLAVIGDFRKSKTQHDCQIL